jgi:hypothetical protein
MRSERQVQHIRENEHNTFDRADAACSRGQTQHIWEGGCDMFRRVDVMCMGG